MALQKTSIQLDPEARDRVLNLYPGLSISEIVRLAIDYVIYRRPKIQNQQTRFEEEL